MRPGTRLTAAALTAAALVPAAIVGSSAVAADSSSATAGGAPSAHRHAGRPAPDTAALAAKLGVSETALKSALSAIRPTGRPAKPANGRGGQGDMAAKLAAALNVGTDKVTAILDANRPTTRPAPGTRPDESKLVSALATGLGVEEATVKAALTKLRPAGGPGRHGGPGKDFAAKLAVKLNLSTETVSTALESMRPARPAPIA